jgi:hypothetical protein
MVAKIAVAGQPDASVDGDQFAAEVAQVECLAGADATRAGVARVGLEGPAMKPVELRVHHQSPEWDVAMIVVPLQTIQ